VLSIYRVDSAGNSASLKWTYLGSPRVVVSQAHCLTALLIMTVLLAVAALDTGPVSGFVAITSLVIAIAAAKHAKLGIVARYVANFCYYLSDSLSCVHVLIEPY
jgi:hypothetical protein